MTDVQQLYEQFTCLSFCSYKVVIKSIIHEHSYPIINMESAFNNLKCDIT